MIDAFNLTSRYLDGLLNIDNIHFELQLNKANASDTEAAFKTKTYLIIMIQFIQKYVIHGVVLILILIIFRPLMVMPSAYVYISTYSLCQSIFAC